MVSPLSFDLRALAFSATNALPFYSCFCLPLHETSIAENNLRLAKKDLSTSGQVHPSNHSFYPAYSSPYKEFPLFKAEESLIPIGKPRNYFYQPHSTRLESKLQTEEHSGRGKNLTLRNRGHRRKPESSTST